MPPPDQEAFLEEATLLAQIGAGDRDAFRELYARYSPPLFSLAIRLLGDTGRAEEALQDAFVKIWRHAASYDARKSRPFTWSVTILRRTCIDLLRRQQRQPEMTPMTGGDIDLAARAGAVLPPSGRDTAEARETATRIQDAMSHLPPPQRRVLELALFSTLTQAEIAAHLTQPVGTIKSWIRRGLLELRQVLNESAP